MRQTVIRIRRQNPDKAVFRSSRRDSAGASTPDAEQVPYTSQAATEGDADKQPTRIDRAHAAMIAGGEAELIDFYRALAETELFILLEGTDGPDPMDLKVIPMEGDQYALVFDQMDRVDGFAGADAPVSELAGLGLFNLLRGRGIGVAVNMGDTPSTMMIPGDAIDWICDTLEKDAPEDEPKDEPEAESEPEIAQDLPKEPSGKFKALLAPRNFPDSLLNSLSDKLSAVARHVDKALLLWAEYQGGQSGFVVAFSGVDEKYRSAVADAVSAALTAARKTDFVLDIVFLPKNEASLDRISRLATQLIPDPHKTPKGSAGDLPFVSGAGAGKPSRS